LNEGFAPHSIFGSSQALRLFFRGTAPGCHGCCLDKTQTAAAVAAGRQRGLVSSRPEASADLVAL